MGHKRAVVYKKRKVVYQESDSKENNTEEEDNNYNDEIDDDDPYEEIKLDDLLAPIERPEQVATHPAISKTFTSNTLRYMSSRALEIISQEQEHVVKLAKLMSAFLGDDPSYLLANKLNLPQYTNEGEEDDDFVRFGNSESANPDTNGSTNGLVKSEDSDKRITRTQSTQEIDPFFALPQINIDQNFGILPENAEETRQLTQIAQQRMEEFIRSMVNVRSGLLRADRYRNKVYLWCQKMNGGDELPDSITSDPSLKKKHEIDSAILAAEEADEKAGK